MTSEPPPSSSPQSSRFRTRMRGYEPAEVDRAIDELVAERRRLTEERDVLQARLDARGARPGRRVVGGEQGHRRNPETARLAAGGMRDRAAADAARWRKDATEAGEAHPRGGRRRRGDAPLGVGHRYPVARRRRCRGGEPALRAGTRDRGAPATSERGAHRHVTLAKSEAEEIVTWAKTTADERWRSAPPARGDRRAHPNEHRACRGEDQRLGGAAHPACDRGARPRPSFRPSTTRSRRAGNVSRWSTRRSRGRWEAPASRSASG